MVRPLRFRWGSGARLMNTDDALAPYRDRLMAGVTFVGAVALTPFMISNFREGRSLLGAAMLLVVAAFAVETLALQRNKPPPIPYPLLLVPIALGTAISLRTQGIFGALWSYPAVLFVFLVLPRKAAIACAALLI